MLNQLLWSMQEYQMDTSEFLDCENLARKEESKSIPEEIELWNNCSIVKSETFLAVKVKVFQQEGGPCKSQCTLIVHGRVDIEDVFRVFLNQHLHERLMRNKEISGQCLQKLWNHSSMHTGHISDFLFCCHPLIIIK